MQKLSLPTPQPENDKKKLPWCSPTIKKLTAQETDYYVGTGADGDKYSSGL